MRQAWRQSFALIAGIVSVDIAHQSDEPDLDLRESASDGASVRHELHRRARTADEPRRGVELYVHAHALSTADPTVGFHRLCQSAVGVDLPLRYTCIDRCDASDEYLAGQRIEAYKGLVADTDPRQSLFTEVGRDNGIEAHKGQHRSAGSDIVARTKPH